MECAVSRSFRFSAFIAGLGLWYSIHAQTARMNGAHVARHRGQPSMNTAVWALTWPLRFVLLALLPLNGFNKSPETPALQIGHG